MITATWKNICSTLQHGTRNAMTLSTDPSVANILMSNTFNVKGERIESISIYNASPPFGNINNMNLYNNFSTNTVQSTYSYYGGYNTSNTATGGCTKFVFGSGTTEATASDYSLEKPIDEGIIGNDINCTNIYNKDTGLYETVLTFVGIVSQDTIITEVGLVKTLMYDRCSNGNYADGHCQCNVLACREVLNKPLNLKAGDSFMVSIKIAL